MKVNGIFRIKGRGWVLSVPYEPYVKIGQHVLDEQDRMIGFVGGVELTTGNYGITGEMGIVLSCVIEDLLPHVGDVISIV